MAITKFGPTSVIQPVEVPDPVPGPGEVLVRVTSSTVNPLDCRIRSGDLSIVVNKRFPKILGCDVAGVVERLGPGASAFREGDRVFGLIDIMKNSPGAFAERVAVGEARLRKIPGGVSDADAAALPCAGLAALQAVREFGQVKAGTRVLVNGASGGVGTLAVQLAKLHGGHVTAVCSARNAELVKRLGADEVIDYAQQDPAAQPGRYDVWIEAVGSVPYGRARRALARGGIWVTIAISPSVLVLTTLRRLFGAKVHIVQAMGAVAGLDALAQFVAEKKLEIPKEATLPLAELAKANELVDGGRVRGKVIVSVP